MIIWGDKSGVSTSRTEALLKALRELNLPVNFSIVDIACGQGTDLESVLDSFPYCNALGIDILEFPEWEGKSARFKKEPLQDFIKMPSKWNVVMMLNSYRNWEGSEKVAFDEWKKTHTEYFIWDDIDGAIHLEKL